MQSFIKIWDIKIEIYDIFMFLGYITLIVFSIFYGKYKFSFSFKKTLLIILFLYPSIFILIIFLKWAETGFKQFGGQNLVRGLIYIPLLLITISKIFKINYNTLLAFVAPLPCLVQGISHFGCAFAGCCHGFPNSWGIYNIYEEKVLFPIQFIEAIVALIIFAIIVIYNHKKGVNNGLSFAIMLMLFGGTRFLLEFLRDNEKLILNISSLAFHALFMHIVGIIMYIILKRKQITNKRTFI